MTVDVERSAAVRKASGEDRGAIGRLLRGENLLALLLFPPLFIVPMVASGYLTYILPQYLLFGVLAMTLTLLWGHVGMVSFGQAAFFAIGAYSLGAMTGSGYGPGMVWVGLAVAIMVTGAIAGGVGYFLFSANVRGSYFVVVTLALSTIAQVVATSESQLTGGFNGMFVPRVTLDVGFASLSLISDVSTYYTISTLTLLAYVGFRVLEGSAFGRILVSIRENEERTRSLGYNTAVIKTAAFAISGIVAGLAGALYATTAGFVAPNLAGVLFSTSVVVWVAIGGRRYFISGLIGAVVISLLSSKLNSEYPLLWQLLLGVLFLGVVTLLRRGAIDQLLESRWWRSASDA